MYHEDIGYKKNPLLPLIMKTILLYTKEHTKPLFKSHITLTVHSLYVNHKVIELYKILKFRTPYCLFEMIYPPGAN